MERIGADAGDNRIDLRNAKKKLQSELIRYFPKQQNKASSLNDEQRQRLYLLALAEQAIDPNPETDARLRARLIDVLDGRKPLCFRDGPGNILVQLEKAVQKMNLTLIECGCPNPESLTLFGWCGWQESLQEKYDNNQPIISPKQR